MPGSSNSILLHIETIVKEGGDPIPDYNSFSLNNIDHVLSDNINDERIESSNNGYKWINQVPLGLRVWLQ